MSKTLLTVEAVADALCIEPESVASFKRCRGTIRVVDNYGDVFYLYRGQIIERNADISPGYYGAWRASLRTWGDSLADVKAMIDRLHESSI